MGLHYHPKVHVQGWGMFRNEPDPKDEVCDVFSEHKTLKYTENAAPRHWNVPDCVDESETPILRLEDLIYDVSWDWLMPVVDKINNEIIPDKEEEFPDTTSVNDPKSWKYWSYRHIKLSTDIEQVYDDVVSFIKCYNNTLYNYVVITEDGVGMVVDHDEWYWWPGIKTTMTDEQIDDMDSFREACNELMQKVGVSKWVN